MFEGMSNYRLFDTDCSLFLRTMLRGESATVANMSNDEFSR